MTSQPAPPGEQGSTTPKTASYRRPVPGYIDRRSTVLTLRHGLTTWNSDGRWQGWTDVPLADEGIEQARRGAKRLGELGWSFSSIITSDLERARHTAELIGDHLDIVDISVDEGWKERHVGDWAGRTTPEIEHGWPGALDRWRSGQLDQTPNGEREQEFLRRIVDALHRALDRASSQKAKVLVVSHGGVIRTLERHHGAAPRPVHNIGGRWFYGADPVLPGDPVDLIDDHRPDSVAL